MILDVLQKIQLYAQQAAEADMRPRPVRRRDQGELAVEIVNAIIKGGPVTLWACRTDRGIGAAYTDQWRAEREQATGGGKVVEVVAFVATGRTE